MYTHSLSHSLLRRNVCVSVYACVCVYSYIKCSWNLLFLRITVYMCACVRITFVGACAWKLYNHHLSSVKRLSSFINHCSLSRLLYFCLKLPLYISHSTFSFHFTPISFYLSYSFSCCLLCIFCVNIHCL